MAAGCIKCLKDMNIKIPEEVTVTGFDNIIESYEHSLNLTTIDQNISIQAYKAVEAAYALANGETVPSRIVVDANIIYRKTCGCTNPVDINTNSNEAIFDKYIKNLHQTIYLHYYMAGSQKALPFEDLDKRLVRSFELFDIPSTMICLYKNVIVHEREKNFYLPDQAQLVFKYDVNEGVVHPNIWFDPSQYLLPEDYQETKFHGAQIVYPLFSEEYHYGFMLIGFGGYETFFLSDRIRNPFKGNYYIYQYKPRE